MLKITPLCSVDRSHDGQIWETLSYSDTRFLFHELNSRFTSSLDDLSRPDVRDTDAADRTPARNLAAVIDMLEHGRTVLYADHAGVLYLRAAGRSQYSISFGTEHDPQLVTRDGPRS